MGKGPTSRTTSNALRSFSRLRSIALGLPLQDKIEKTLIEISCPVLRNFDDVLRIRYLQCQPFLAEAWSSCSGV